MLCCAPLEYARLLTVFLLVYHGAFQVDSFKARFHCCTVQSFGTTLIGLYAYSSQSSTFARWTVRAEVDLWAYSTFALFKKGKGFPYLLPNVGSRADSGVQAVSPKVTKASTRRLLPSLSARPAVTFPAAEHHRPLACTKFYCLMTKEHTFEQLVQGCYAAFAPIRIWTHDLLIASSALYPLHHLATYVRT